MEEATRCNVLKRYVFAGRRGHYLGDKLISKGVLMLHLTFFQYYSYNSKYVEI